MGPPSIQTLLLPVVLFGFLTVVRQDGRLEKTLKNELNTVYYKVRPLKCLIYSFINILKFEFSVQLFKLCFFLSKNQPQTPNVYFIFLTLKLINPSDAGNLDVNYIKCQE